MKITKEYIDDMVFCSKMIELKPCPFCGGIATITTNKTSQAQKSCIRCSKCSCQKTMLKYPNYDGDIEKDIIEVWNRRAGEQE